MYLSPCVHNDTEKNNSSATLQLVPLEGVGGSVILTSGTGPSTSPDSCMNCTKESKQPSDGLMEFPLIKNEG